MKAKKILLSLIVILALLIGVLAVAPFSAMAQLDATAVTINDKTFSTLKTYYKNGGADATDDSSDWNAHYDSSNNTLYLNDYVGGAIEFGGALTENVTIVLSGTNVINTDYQKAIANYNGGNITISANSSASLTINQNVSGFSTIYGIATEGQVAFAGKAEVNVNVSGTNEQVVYGVYSQNSAVTVVDGATLNVVAATTSSLSGITVGAGIYAGDSITFNTTGSVKVDVSGYASPNGNIGIYAASNVVLTSASELRILTKAGSYCVPVYPASAVASFTNHNVSESTNAGVLTTVYAQKGVETLNLTLTEGVLSWNAITGATGYEVVLLNQVGTELNRWDNANTNANRVLAIVAEMNNVKYDSGSYILKVEVKGVSGKDATKAYYYTSNVEKLPAPTNVAWIGANATWDFVDGAESYKVTLYNFEGQVTTLNVTGEGDYPVDFSSYLPQDGWTFTVQALSNGSLSAKRNSTIEESNKYGSVTRTLSQVNSGNSLNMSIDSLGVLTWDEVVGATGYLVDIMQANGVTLYTWENTNRVISLVAELDSFKYNSALYTILVRPQGVSGKNASMTYYYTSNVERLPAPTNLVWIGNKAAWDAVEGASSYQVTLYNLEGQVATQNTTNCLYDFTTEVPLNGWTFTVQAQSNGTLNAKRNSNVAESPARDEESYTVTIISNNGGLDLPIVYEGQTGNFLLPECTFTAPSGKEFDCWAIGTIEGEQKAPGSAYTLNSNLYIVAIWKDKAFTVEPGNATLVSDEGYTFDYQLSVDATQINVQSSTDGGMSWENFSILASPAPEKNTLTSGTIGCPAVGWTGEKLLRLNAWDSMSNQYYSEPFTVKWVASVFTTQPQSVVVPVGKPALITYELGAAPTTLNIQYEVSAGVWEHLQGTDGETYSIISEMDEEKTLSLRLMAIIDSDAFYSSTFTVSWSNSAEEWGFNQEIDDVTLKVGEAENIAWSVNFATTSFDICYWDETNEVWDQYDTYTYDPIKLANLSEDYDFQENEKISLKFKIVAKQGDFTLSSNEFTINWVSYTVSFDGNGYQGIGAMLPVSGLYGEYVLPECNFVAPSGYFFKAWAVGSVEGTQYDEGETINVNANVTIYAIWEELIEVASFNQLKVALNSNTVVGVKLTENIIAESDAKDDVFEISSGCRYIDLNGYTLKVTFTSTTYKEAPLFAVKNSAKLTIVNGTINYASPQATISSDGVILLVGNAQLYTEKVNIINDRIGSCVYARDDSIAVINGGIITARQGYAVRVMHSANVTLDGAVELKTLQEFATDNFQAAANGSLEVVFDDGITLNVKSALFSNGILIYPTLKSSFENHVVFVCGVYQNANFNVYANISAAKEAGAKYYWVEDNDRIYLSDSSVGAYYPACLASFYSKDVKYEIEVENATASVGGNEVSEGYYYEEITITADEIDGKVFDQWVVSGENGIILGDVYSATTTFRMTYAKVIITATYKNAPINYVEITFSSPAIGDMLPRDASVSHEGLVISTAANGNPEWDIEWKVDDALVENGIFLPGKTYKAGLSLHIVSADWSIDENVYVSINGIGANLGFYNGAVQVVFYEFTMPSVDFTTTYTENSRAGIGGVLEIDEKAIKESNGLYENGDFEYVWYKDDVEISGATASTYKIKTEDANSKIYALVRIRESGYDYYGVSEEKTIDYKVNVININYNDIEGDCYVPNDADSKKLFTTDDTFGTVRMVVWYNGTMQEMAAGDALEVGETYILYVMFQLDEGYVWSNDVMMRLNGGALEYSDSSIPAQRVICKLIEIVAVEHEHIYAEGFVYNAYDEEYHWKECTYKYCANKEGSAIEYVDHYAVGATCSTSGTCICGKTGVYGAHDFENGSYVKFDETYHVKECAICHETNEDYNAHVGGTATCYAKAICTACGEEYGSALDHDLSDGWTYKDANGHAHSCENAGCTHHDEIAPHVPNIPSATESEAKVCTVCGYVIAPALAHTHNLTHVPAVSATCTAIGNSAYYTCGCGQCFSDANAQNLIENHSSVIISALDHNYDGVAWSYDADEHYKVCSRDNCEVKSQVETHSGGVADCQNQAECSVCGASYGNFGGHDFGDTWDYKDADGHAHKCTIHGCTDHDVIVPHTPNVAEPTEQVAKVCTACGYVIAPALNHVHSLTPVAATPATCMVNGNSAYYTCTCGQWFSDAEAENLIANHDSVIIIAPGHSHGATWEKDATNHWNECSCGDRTNIGAHVDENSDGNCDVCGWVDPNFTPVVPGPGEGGQGGSTPDNTPDATEPESANEGLSGGAIAGIAVGSTVGAIALGAGGFAIFWFVIKKKSMAELLALLKIAPKAKVNPDAGASNEFIGDDANE